MAQTSAVIDVVAAEQCAEKFLQQVVVFVGRLGATVNCHGVGPIALVNLAQAVRAVIKSFVPRNFAPLLSVKRLRTRAGCLFGFTDERCGHPVFIINEIITEAAFDAEVAAVDDGIKWRGDFINVVVLDVQFELAADAAVRTGSRGDVIGTDHGDFLPRLLTPRLAWMISLRSNPLSRSASRLGLSAPVGQTPTHWPQKTQLVSGIDLSKNVPIPVSKPRPLKLIA